MAIMLMPIAGMAQKNIFEKYRIKTYQEAGFKPYIIAAMMFANKFTNPASVLKNILKNESKRVIY